ncbi:MAG: acyltransferase family protein [Alphaproteobacteria bacterium]
MKKLQSFDTFKYLLALCVLIGHAFINLWPPMLMPLAAYAVDGFFLISGFFLAKSCLCVFEKESNPYIALKTSIINRYKRLSPEMLFGAVLSGVIGLFCLKNIDWGALVFNISFLGQINRMPSLINGMWYLSVLFWVSAILSAIVFFKNKNINSVKYVILPLIILICILFVAPNVKHLTMHGNTFRIFNTWSDGWFKGLLEISLGMETYFIAQSLKEKNIKIKFSFALELLGLFLVIYPMFGHGLSVTDFMLLPGYMILIILLYLNQENLLKCWSWKILGKITKCSYMLFILNVAILEAIKFNGEYVNYPIWLVCLVIIIGTTIIALIAQKLCALTLKGLQIVWSYINNVKSEKIIKIVTYLIVVFGLIIGCCVYYNNKMVMVNLKYLDKQTSALYLNDSLNISKDFSVLFPTKLRHIDCRFYTWKNKYAESDVVYFSVLNTKDGSEIVSEVVKLNDIKDNDVLNVKTNANLLIGKYKFIIRSDKINKPFAVSVIKTFNKGNYYINGTQSDKNNDIQCVLTH